MVCKIMPMLLSLFVTVAARFGVMALSATLSSQSTRTCFRITQRIRFGSLTTFAEFFGYSSKKSPVGRALLQIFDGTSDRDAEIDVFSRYLNMNGSSD